MNEFTRSGRDPLDEALASLPQDVRPERDLWPQIHAEIAKTPIVAHAPTSALQSTWFRLAATVLLVLATSFVTYYVTRQSMQQPIARRSSATSRTCAAPRTRSPRRSPRTLPIRCCRIC